MRVGLPCLLLLLLARPARAEELELSVGTAGEAACAEVDVAGAVEAALGRPLGRGETVLGARVAMRREGRRVRIVVGLERDGARSERRLAAADCAAAARVAGLVIALALDPEPGLDAAPPSLPVAPAVVPRETTERALPIVPRQTTGPALAIEPRRDRSTDDGAAPSRAARTSGRGRDAGSTPSITLLAGGVVDVGALPGVNAGAVAGVGLRASLAVVELEGTYLSAVRASASQPGAGAELVLAYGTLRAGVLYPLLERLGVGLVAELDVGAMNGTATGVRVQGGSSAVLPWVALRAALLVAFALSPGISLRASGSVGTPLLAPSFEIAGVGAVFAPSGVLVQGALTLVASFS